jgi:hypothetical protein
VIRVRVIAALAADELEGAGVAAVRLALRDAGRPTPQGRRAAVAALVSMSVSARLTRAYLQVGSFIICRGLERHDKAESQHYRVQATRAVQ